MKCEELLPDGLRKLNGNPNPPWQLQLFVGQSNCNNHVVSKLQGVSITSVLINVNFT